MATRPVIVKFKDNYWRIYHGRDEIMLKSLDELPGEGISAKAVFQSGMEGFSHFVYSVDGSPFEKSADGCIEVHFKDEPTDQHTTIIVKGVSEDGKETNPYTVHFGCYPTKFYESKQMSGYPNIIIIDSSPILNFSSGSVEDWILSKPTPQEKQFASEKWADLVKDAETDYDKAKLLIKSLMDDLWPANGMPSDEMYVSPFEQYERMVSGKDKGFCSNFAAIFVCASNALGIPARRIHMQQIHSSSDKCRIQGGSMHSTTEIFDRQLNHWVWMDISFYAMGAYLGEEGPLDMAELHLFLNQPARRERLRFHVYNLEDKSDKILPLAECPKSDCDCWNGWDVEFHYSRENIEE